MKKNVFISYSRKDEILISKFRQEERGREFEILIDDEEIVLNEAWQDTIIKKINDNFVKLFKSIKLISLVPYKAELTVLVSVSIDNLKEFSNVK